MSNPVVTHAPAAAFSCNNCGCVIDELAQTPIVCGCGYHNLRQGVVDVSLDELLGPSFDAPSTEDSSRVLEILEGYFESLLVASLQVVQSDPPAAQAALWDLLCFFEETALAQRRSPELGPRMLAINRTIQILQGWLWQLQLPAVGTPLPDRDRARRFMSELSSITSNFGVLPGFLNQLRTGLLTGQIRGRRLIFKATPPNRGMAEWQHNQNEEWERSGYRASERVFSAPSVQAQAAMLGFSPELLATVLDGGRRDLHRLAVRQSGRVYVLDSDDGDVPAEYRIMFDALTLTRERAREFSEPFYWDLGETGDAPESIPRKLAGRNWLNYYPVLRADASGGSEWWISAEALTIAAANLETFKGRLLERVYERLRASGHDRASLKQVNELRLAANREFESIAVTRFVQGGFEAVGSLTRLEGEPLSCGEIDVLAVRRTGTTLLMIVGEVKDLDLSLHRAAGVATLAAKLRKAERQLSSKLEGVHGMWRRVLELQFGERDVNDLRVVLMGILITSRYLPPMLQRTFPLVAIDSLDEFIQRQGEGGWVLQRFETSAVRVCQEAR